MAFINFIGLFDKELNYDHSNFDTGIIVSVDNSLPSSHFEHLPLQKYTIGTGSPLNGLH